MLHSLWSSLCSNPSSEDVMKRALGIVAGITFAALLPGPAAAQMMQGGMMGGGRHGMINLVSPADSPTQIRRGAVMIGSYAFGMMGQSSTGSGMPGRGGGGTAGIRVVLRLYGVTDANGLVTSTGNHLIFEGQLTTPTDNSTPISIDQLFALNAGAALVEVPLSMSISGPATITIDRIAVEDDGENAFAVPGINLTRPTPQGTPQATHTPGHMGPGGGPMM